MKLYFFRTPFVGDVHHNHHQKRPQTLMFAIKVCLCLLTLQNQTAFAQSSLSVPFSPGVAEQVLRGIPNNGALNCRLLINQTWPYPTPQVNPVCQDATNSCIRYSLIQRDLKRAKGERLAALKQAFPLARNDVQLKLMGCVVAIEATMNGGSLLGAAGY